MVEIPAGTFEMGSENGYKNECPAHKVTITHDYYLDETEVTNKAYASVMGESPSRKGFDGPDQPVTNVSWGDADKYCRTIGKRLPTEAEWENGASVGGKYLFGTKSGTEEKLADEACFHKEKTCDVKGYPPNDNGLYGMSGNVWEWVSDWRGDYPSEHVIDPKGPDDGSYRVLRGGAWSGRFLDYLRSVYRFSSSDYGNNYIGFRCASDDPSK